MLAAQAARVAIAVLLAVGCAADPPPDVVLVTFDTLRWDHVGLYADRATGSLTPNLDGWAADARIFQQAFTPMPTTAPAHASLLTGLHPSEHGIVRNGDSLAASLVPATLQARLREVGYATGAFVTSRVFGEAMGMGGFDHWDAPSEPLRPGVDAVHAALEWIDHTPSPIFLWLHLYDPHSPYGFSRQKPQNLPVDPSRYGWVEPAGYEDPGQRELMRFLYAQGVRDADRALGLLIDGLAVRGREPWCAITADHGELLDERLDDTGFAYGHGSMLTHEVLRIPMLLKGPGVAPGRIMPVTTLRDLYTTILGAAGIEDAEAEGASRFDLRRPIPEARVVLAARRLFSASEGSSDAVRAAASAAVRRHRVAATDGARLLVLGEDGTPTEGERDEALLDAARRMLEQERAARAARTDTSIDAETLSLLKALGYAE